MNVVVIYGGRSGEHEISLMSCASVIRNIGSQHKVTLVSISKEGRWFLEDGSVLENIRNNADAVLSVTENPECAVSVNFGLGKDKAFSCRGEYIPCDVVLPVLHGTYGEDGTIQGLFEMAGVPYAGCGVLSSSVCMDKDTTKILLAAAGIPVVPSICLTRAQINDSKLYDSLLDQAEEKLGYPVFVKPCAAGSSDGANKANNRRQLSFALMEAFAWDNKVLIEKGINAREVECSVTGNAVSSDPNVKETLVTAYGPGEIVPKHEFYDYDAKYNDPDGAELKIPALLDEEKLEYMRCLAMKAYEAVNGTGLSRVDFFIDRDNGNIYLNEINTMPGFTKISMFPKMCEAFGLDYTKLIDLLLVEAVEQFKSKSALRTDR